MPGLLGDSFDDPRTLATLQMAAGLLGGGNFGQAASRGLGDYQKSMAVATEQQRRQRELAMQEAEQRQRAQVQAMQMQAAQQEAARLQGIQAAHRDAIDLPGTPGIPGSVNQERLIRGLMQHDPIAAAQLLQPKARKLVTLSPGQQVFDEADPTKPVFSAPEKPEAKPEIIKILGMLHGEGTPAFMDALRQYQVKATTHAPAPSAVSYGSPVPIMLKDGTIGYAQPGNKPGAAPMVMAGPDGKPMTKPGEDQKPATVEEKTAAGFASRMVESTKLLDDLEKKGRPTYATDAAGGLPLIGNKARTAAMSPVQQQYRQAQEDWVRAKLRKESGAAIPPDEMDREILTYFPQPGETDPKILEQKRRSRAIANEAMERTSGRAAYKSAVPPLDDSGQGLSAAEAAELAALRQRFGKGQ